MNRIAFIVLVVITTCLPNLSQAAIEDAQRPKIGLVLSGGGARGAAHVGVIRKLEEYKIPIDYIAGTSMGSIIGGLYASGKTPDEIEKLLTTIDWDSAFSDKSDRVDRTFRRKFDDALYLVKHKPGISDEGEILLPGGLLQGQKIDLILSKLTLHAANTNNFDNLAIPFRAVASDLTTGNAVVISSGNLGKAMRASMNIPAAFAPIKIDEKLLIDGGVANNLPIDVVRKLGADIVIAVDISTPLLKRDELKNILTHTEQLTGILTRKNTEEQLATLTKRDVLLVPDLGEISTSDFDRAIEAVPTGEKAAQDNETALRQLSISNEQYARHIVNRGQITTTTSVINFVRLDNQSPVSDEVISSKLSIKSGDQLNLDQIEHDIALIYGLDLFENVNYEIVEEDGQTGVIVHAREKSWGPNYLQFGIAISDNLEGDNTVNLSVAYTRHAINKLNGEWRSALQLGEDPLLITELYQPLDAKGKTFIHVGAFGEQRNLNIFDSPGDQIGEYRIDRVGAFLSGGLNFGTWGELRLGYRRESGDAEVRVGDPAIGDFDFDSAEVFTKFSVDTLDDLYFPRKGWATSLEISTFQESLGGDDDFEQLDFNILGAKTWGKNTLLAGIRFQTTQDDDAPIYGRFRTGGFTTLSGFNQNELSGQHVGLLRLGYLRRINDFSFLPAYVGATLEYGNAWQVDDDIFDDNITAGSVFFGVDTPIGPIYTGYGHAEGGHDSLYVFLGKLF